MFKKILETVKRKWKMAAIAGVIVILAGAVWYYQTGNKNVVVAEARTATVTRDKIEVKVSETGSVQPSTSRSIVPNVSGTIAKINFRNGQQVKKGDLLFELNNDSIDSQIKNARLNLEQAQLQYNSLIDDRQQKYVNAPITGQITTLEVENGQGVQKNSVLMEISDTTRLEFKVPVNAAQINLIKPGQVVDVTAPSLMTTFQGRVKKVDRNGTPGSDGSRMYTVTVEISNLGALSPGLEVQADIHTANGIETAYESSTLEWAQTVTLRAPASGTLKNFTLDASDYVAKGQRLGYIINDDTDSTDLRAQELKTQQARLTLAEAQKDLADCKIYAPVDGQITLNTSEANETRSSGSGSSSSGENSTTYWQVGDQATTSSVLATIIGNNGMQVTVPVDEVDVGKVQLGQKAAITVDAIPDKVFDGTVAGIASKGTEQNGVSTFDVTVSIDKSQGLKENMTANVEILVAQKDNALLLPVEAVQEQQGKKFVLIPVNGNNNGADDSTEASGRSQGKAEEGNEQKIQAGNQAGRPTGNQTRTESSRGNGIQRGRMVPVKTGLYNDTMIEITSGLSEGDVVNLPSIASSSGTNSQNSRGAGMMFGGPRPGGSSGGGVRINRGGGG